MAFPAPPDLPDRGLEDRYEVRKIHDPEGKHAECRQQSVLTPADKRAIIRAILGEDDERPRDPSDACDAVLDAVEAILRDREDYHLAMHRAYRPEVVAEVAVYLGDHDNWEGLAEWCGGRIESSTDPSGECSSVLRLPNGECGGEQSWLVLNHAGEFHFRDEVAAPDPESIATEWAFARGNDPAVQMSEQQARTQAVEWNRRIRGLFGTDVRAAVMRRTVTPWVEVEA